MNQNSDFINGDPHSDAYLGRLTVVAKPQTLPLFEGFEVGSMTALGGFVNPSADDPAGEPSYRVTMLTADFYFGGASSAPSGEVPD